MKSQMGSLPFPRESFKRTDDNRSFKLWREGITGLLEFPLQDNAGYCDPNVAILWLDTPIQGERDEIWWVYVKPEDVTRL